MNFGALKSSVIDWSNRTNLTPALLLTFLQLAEQRIFWGEPAAQLQPLRAVKMLTSTTLTPAGGAATLPADFLDFERVASLGSDGFSKTPLSYRSNSQLGRFELISGAPQFFGVRSGQIVFGPRITDQVELLYYARPATPSADADENWLMLDNFGVYLYGMLIEVALYLRDDDLQAQARALYQNAIAAVQQASDQMQDGGMTSLAIMPDRGAL